MYTHRFLGILTELSYMSHLLTHSLTWCRATSVTHRPPLPSTVRLCGR